MNQEEEEIKQEVAQEDQNKISQNVNSFQQASQQSNISNSQKQSIIKLTPKKTPNARHSLLFQQQLKPKERLIIKKIVVNNFKSYLGESTIGPFHKRFTAIVGPNGSGKSNLIESMLFVFGKKASWMRLKQLHELIYNQVSGNEVKKASVTVYFEEIVDKEGDDYDIIQGSEFNVKRTVTKSNVSKYKIDNQAVTQKEVIEKLQQKGIDLNNNRFLILQGEVEQISMMKPKSGNQDNPGLLEYLEDIIGSNQYQLPIEELEQKYQLLEEDKNEKGRRKKISQEDLGKLNERKNIAVEYIKLEKVIYQIINVQFQIQRFRANDKLMIHEEKQKQIQMKIDQLKQECKAKLKENEEQLKVWKEKKKQMENTKQIKKQLDTSLQKLTENDHKLRVDLKFDSENQVTLEKQIDQLDKQYQKIIDESKDINDILPQKKEALQDLMQKKEEQEQKLRDLNLKVKQKADKLISQKKQLEKQLQPTNKQLKELESQRQVLQNKLDLLNTGNDEITEQIELINNQNNETTKTVRELEDVLAQLKTALEKIDQRKEELQNALQNVQVQERQVDQDMMEIKQKLDQNKQSHQENHQRNYLINDLLSAQQKRELNGICGRLGDLATIDQAYDCAITTSCQALENIVVRTYDDAQRCVAYLRENKIGKATFISLDKSEQYRGQMNKPFIAPEGCQRLFDLLQFKSEDYKVVFYFALRDTLVCQNLDIAARVAYGPIRYKVVTLDGKLIDYTGVMSGGGQPKKGGMSSSKKSDYSMDDMNKLNQNIQQCYQFKEELTQKSVKVKQELFETQKDYQFAKSQFTQKQIDYDMQKQQLKDNENKINKYNNMLSTKQKNKNESQQLVEKLSQIEKQVQEITTANQDLQKQLSEVEEQINNIGGDEFKKLKSQVESMAKQFADLEKEVAKMKTKLENTDKNLEKNEKEKSDVKIKLDRNKQKIDKVQAEINQLEEQAIQILAKLKAATEQITKLEQEEKVQNSEKQQFDKLLSEMKKSLEKMNQEFDGCKQEQKKAKQDYDRADQVIKDNRKKYVDIIQEYDFLNEIDEIASYKIDDEAIDKQNQELLAREKEKMNPPQEEGNQIVGEHMEIEEEKQEVSQSLQQSSQKLNMKQKKIIQQDVDMNYIQQIDINYDLTQEQLNSLEKWGENLQIKLTFQQENLKKLQSETNIKTIKEFKEKYQVYKERKTELEKVQQELKESKVKIDDLKKKRQDTFMDGFNIISSNLKETYQNLNKDGDAELEIIDTHSPFSEGINFTVRPPKKSWKPINKLSGGEKTLSSLALIFALHQYKPTPLYFLDEIDASLDYRNAQIVGQFIKERTKDAQFIIISLRNNMFELANKLVGIYKTNNITKNISIIPEQIMRRLAAEKLDQQQQQQQNQIKE